MDENRIEKPGLLSPLVLAYIGDSVYEMYVRNRIVSQHPDMPAYKLHKIAIKYVCAKAQSHSILALETELTDAECAVYKRGRNAKSATVPKNAEVVDYRRATGFEALVGYLYLNDEKQRLIHILEKAFDVVEAELQQK